MYKAHISSDTSAGEGKEEMSIDTVYMCGGEDEDIISHSAQFPPEVTGVICEPVHDNGYFNACTSGHFKATNMRHMVVRETSGRIGAGILFNSLSLHAPGVHLVYVPPPRAATACITLGAPARNEKPYRCMSASTSCGTTVTIWSQYELEPRFWLVHDILAVDPVAWGYTLKSGVAVPKIRKAFGDIGIDECAKLFHTDVRTLVACFSRGCSLDVPFGGNVSHWGRKLNIDGGDQITVRPMTFSDCLGSTLLKFEGKLYHLYTGRPVLLRLGEGGVWHMTETEPGEVDIPADALVG